MQYTGFTFTYTNVYIFFYIFFIYIYICIFFIYIYIKNKNIISQIFCSVNVKWNISTSKSANNTAA